MGKEPAGFERRARERSSRAWVVISEREMTTMFVKQTLLPLLEHAMNDDQREEMKRMVKYDEVYPLQNFYRLKIDTPNGTGELF